MKRYLVIPIILITLLLAWCDDKLSKEYIETEKAKCNSMWSWYDLIMSYDQFHNEYIECRLIRSLS